MSGCPRCCVRDGNFKASGFGLKKSRNFLQAKGRKMIGSVSSETVAVFTAPAFSFMDRNYNKLCAFWGSDKIRHVFSKCRSMRACEKNRTFLFCLKRSVNRAKQGQNGWTPVAKVSFDSCFLDISGPPGLRRNQWWGPKESPGRITREARNKLRSKKRVVRTTQL